MRFGALVLQHGPLAPAGLLGAWLEERGIPVVLHRVDQTGAPEDVRDYAMVACLGSRFSPNDATEPSVVATRACVEQAVEHDVPVLGLCFGGQMLSAVLGGRVARLGRPELGWHELETYAPRLIAAGPWLQWHWDGFTAPPGAEVLARSAAGTQAFRAGRHLGVQFHPESTIEIVSEWARHDSGRLAAEGVADGVALLERRRTEAGTAAAHARRLFDGFWASAERGTT
ncbi:MAG TPA: type 1 glutamine amidotransferase [Solirubrobacter sp.]|nr:type 1 glutamine amidotransferase [Solirubrobacter sp.]